MSKTVEVIKCQTVEEEIIANIVQQGHKHKNYDLNEEKALEKMSKLSTIDNIAQENKTTCVNFQFSSGAYLIVILLFIRKLSTKKFIQNERMIVECTRNEDRCDKKGRIVETNLF